jgi:hypothetical protein
VLLYTGQQRLAKNTLVNALRRCALTPLENTAPHLYGATARSTKSPEHEEEGWKNFFGGISFSNSNRGEAGTNSAGQSATVSIGTVTALVEAAEAGAALLKEFSEAGKSGSTVGNADDVVDSLGAVINR